jgi:hypothetical protein
MLSSHLCLRIPSGLFPLGFPTRILFAFLISTTRSTCLIHLIPLNLITVTIFGETYKLWNSSLCSLLHPPATSSLLDPNILSTLSSNTWICVLHAVWLTRINYAIYSMVQESEPYGQVLNSLASYWGSPGFEARVQILRRINSGTAYNCPIRRLLSSHLLSKTLKMLYVTVILLTVLCGSEAWSFTLREEHTLQTLHIAQESIWTCEGWSMLFLMGVKLGLSH